MNREEAIELLPIIQAFAEGKKIETRYDIYDWTETEVLHLESKNEYRIKSEPKYRPFKSQEECWNEMLKHQPFGWIKSKKSERLFSIGLSFWDNNFNGVSLTFSCNEMLSYCSKSMIKDFTFADGTTFGIKEE